MTPEHRKAKQSIQAAIKRWRHLVPPQIDLRHIWIAGTPGEGDESIATTQADWHYHNASIKWYLANAASQTDAYLEATVVHELVHVLVAPMESSCADKHAKLCEYTVETVTRAIIRHDRAVRAW